jgi:hypothetical protein
MKYTQIAHAIVLCVILALFAVSCAPKKSATERDENNQIILFMEENHDKSIKSKLVLTVKNVQDVIQYIKTNYPSFNFEEEGYKIDNSSIELFVKDFNENGPEYCVIYILGIKSFGGCSSVASWLNRNLDADEPELWSYHFFIDEEYSDYSGIMFSDIFTKTENSETLHLWKRKYGNSNDYYWDVVWPLNDYDEDDDDVKYDDYEVFQLYTKEQKTAILTSFLFKLRETNVYQNLDMDWFEMVYTGIEGSRQRIGDLLRRTSQD